MRIAVVIPTHNRAELLERALASVANQTLPAHECLVVDDGSTDGTASMIKKSWPAVTYLAQPHRGVSAARNLGIQHARAQWIAFLDSDDCWMPDKLARQCRALAGTDHVLCHSEEIWFRHGRRVNPRRKHRKRGGWIYRHCLPLCAISPSTALVRRDVLLRHGGFDESLPACEDYDLWLRLCARYPALLVDEPLTTRYGGHDDQLSARHWGMDRFRAGALEKMLDDPVLSPSERRATLETLVTKLEILVAGARRRGNLSIVAAYQPRLARHRAELATGDLRPARVSGTHA